MAPRRLRAIFFGSSDFAVPSLRRLLEHHNVVAVVSQADKPAGRGLALSSTPVSALARESGVQVFTPAKLDAAFNETLSSLEFELLACASYGKIIPPKILQMPGLRAALNVHPSLLPRYRGPTPIQTALREGRTTTGVSIFWMVQALDAGDIAAIRPVEIFPEDSYGTLHEKLAQTGAQLLLECAAQVVEGTLPRVPQNENEASYTRPLTKEDVQLNCRLPAHEVINQVRSLSPRPGAWLPFRGKRLKILSARRFTDEPGLHPVPGAVLAIGSRTLIKTDPGWLEATRVLLQGKSETTGEQFARRIVALG